MPTWMFSPESPGRISGAELAAAIRANEPVSAANLVVDGDVDCAGVEYSHRLTIFNGTFTGSLNLSESHFARRIDFSGCTFERPLQCSRTEIGGRLVLNSATIKTADANDKTDFLQIRVAGDFEATGLQACAIDLEYAQIEGSLDLRSGDSRETVLGGILKLRAATIQGEVILRGAQTKDIRMVSAEIAGYLLLDPQKGRRTRIDGELWLYGTKIGGKAVLNGLQLNGALEGFNMTVAEDLYCESKEGELAEFGSDIKLGNASISGNVNFAGAKITGDLLLAYANVGGSISLHSQNRTHIEGSLILLGINVVGTVFMGGIEIKKALIAANAKLGALTADDLDGRRTEIGSIFYAPGAKVSGTMTLRGCRIGGDLDLSEAQVGAGLVCSSLDKDRRTEILGNIFLNATDISGAINFDGVRVAKVFYASNAKIQGGLSLQHLDDQQTEIGIGLLLFRARVLGPVVLRGLKNGGPTNLASAEVEDLGCDDPRAELGEVLVLEGLHASSVHLNAACCRGTKINLQLAKLGTLRIIDGLPPDIELVGCEIQYFDLPGDDYRGLLAATKAFRPASYSAMEKWLRDRGHDEAANGIYVDMRRRRRRETLQGLRWLGDWILDISTLYGIASYRLIYYLVFVLVLSTALFSLPRALQHEAPNQDQRPGIYEAVWTATQTAFPMLTIQAAKGWKPASELVTINGSRLPIRYDGYASVVSLLSWIIVPLFIASISGLLKRQK